MNTILIAEDEALLAKMLQKVFTENDFVTHLAEDGKEAVYLYQIYNPDIILMDIDMPYRSGWEVLEIIRKENKTLPVVIMSGKRISEEDSLRSYQLGAVSFFRKPFFPKEVVAHIQSLMKIKYDFEETLVMDGFTLDLSINALSINGEERRLPERESKVLYLLAKNKNKLVKYQELTKLIWHNNGLPSNEQMLRNLITSLRKALQKTERVQIEHIYGKGYIFKITSE
ncbi:DNA-binding response regulator [Bacteroidia bacterium]|nr:DNA-binding response regulator [Bacteroidia bacterium]